MRIVVSGYYGYGNTGDEAILMGMLRSLRDVDPGLQVTVLSGDPRETESTHGVRAIHRTQFAGLLRELRTADGLLSGGGGLLQDRTSARPVAYYTAVMGLARLARRPYAVYAQGLGPIHRRANRALARTALRRAAHVSLRDRASVDLARELGVDRSIDLVPDQAIALQPPRAEGPRRVVAAVRPWGRSTHLAPLRAAIRALSARHHRVLGVPMQERVDRAPTAAVIEDVPGAAALPPQASVDDRIAAIGSASVVIGMRLHALVLAAAAGVPAIAISYDPKVSAFADQVGHQIVGDVETPMDPDAIVRAVEAALATERGPYLQRVEALRDRVRPGAAAALDALRSR